MTQTLSTSFSQDARRGHPLWRTVRSLGSLYTSAMLAIDAWANLPAIRPFALGFIVGGFLLSAGIYAASPWYVLLVNRSNSLPQTLFLLDKTRAPGCGDYTAFDMPSDARFYRGSRMIKHIRGCAGDIVHVEGQRVLINNQSAGLAMRRSSNGQYRLQRIDPIVIPHGKVYLAASHAQSYDSRYASFGLRNTSELLGTARPLF